MMEKESLSVQILAMELAVTVLKDKICELKAQHARAEGRRRRDGRRTNY